MVIESEKGKNSSFTTGKTKKVLLEEGFSKQPTNISKNAIQYIILINGIKRPFCTSITTTFLMMMMRENDEMSRTKKRKFLVEKYTLEMINNMTKHYVFTYTRIIQYLQMHASFFFYLFTNLLEKVKYISLHSTFTYGLKKMAKENGVVAIAIPMENGLFTKIQFIFGILHYSI